MNILDKSNKRIHPDHCDDTRTTMGSKKPLPIAKHKFILVSSKPGVGKTVVAVNLAVALSKTGTKVGLVDANFNKPDIHKRLWFPDKYPFISRTGLRPIDYSDALKVLPLTLEPNKNKKGQNERSLSEFIKSISSVDWGRTNYILFDTSAGPTEELLEVIKSFPDAKVIIVTAPNKIDQKSFTEMTCFVREQNIPIWGWIENMRGFLCQNCDRRLSTIGTGPSGRTIFLNEIPFLGRIPVDINIDKNSDVKTVLTEYPCPYDTEPYDMIAGKIITLIKKPGYKTQR